MSANFDMTFASTESRGTGSCDKIAWGRLDCVAKKHEINWSGPEAVTDATHCYLDGTINNLLLDGALAANGLKAPQKIQSALCAAQLQSHAMERRCE